MDATNRPLQIPPEFNLYAEKHGLFDLNKRLLEQLIVNKPDDPIEFLIDILTKENDDVPSIIVLGPPVSGKYTIAKMLAGRLRCVHLTMKDILEEADRNDKITAEKCLKSKQPIPTDVWVSAVKQRVNMFDCNRKGWVLSGFPQTREQAIAIQSEGVFAKHVILLNAADNVLIERAAGKRIDPVTGDIFHLNFDLPTDDEQRERLEEVPGCTQEEMEKRLFTYHNSIFNLTLSYPKVLTEVNADQPLADVLARCLEIVSAPPRSVAPRNPQILLIGPPGSGKRTQAVLLASKYRIVDVDCGVLVRKVIADDGPMSKIIKPFVDKRALIPDNLMLQIIKERLSQQDCIRRGWVLYNYPRSKSQAEALDSAGFEPNRVVALDVPNHALIERIINRKLDPVTGERYHAIYDPPIDETVASRLVTRPNDLEPVVQRKIMTYRSNLTQLLDHYASNVQSIPADQDIQTVFELIESCIVNAIPKTFD